MSTHTAKCPLPLGVILVVFLILGSLFWYGLRASRGQKDLPPVSKPAVVDAPEQVAPPMPRESLDWPLAEALPGVEVAEAEVGAVVELEAEVVPSVAAHARSVVPSPVASAPPELAPPVRVGPVPSESLLRQTTLQVDMPLREIGQSWVEPTGGQNDFSMPLPDGRDLNIKVERFIAIGEDGGEFIGRVEGYADSKVKLSYRGLGEAGTIRIPSENRVYLYLPGAEGSLVIQELEMDADAEQLPLMLPPESIPPMPEFIPGSMPPNIEALDPGYAPAGS